MTWRQSRKYLRSGLRDPEPDLGQRLDQSLGLEDGAEIRIGRKPALGQPLADRDAEEEVLAYGGIGVVAVRIERLDQTGQVAPVEFLPNCAAGFDDRRCQLAIDPRS